MTAKPGTQLTKVLRISDYRVLSPKQDTCVPTFKSQQHCRREGGETGRARDWGALLWNTSFWKWPGVANTNRLHAQDPQACRKGRTAVWRGLTRKRGSGGAEEQGRAVGCEYNHGSLCTGKRWPKSNMNIKEKPINFRASSGDQKDSPIYYGNQNQMFHLLASIKDVTYF